MRYRFAGARDLRACVGLLPAAFKISARVRSRLQGLWASLIAINPANVVVFEDADRIEGCAIGAHVSDAFVAEYLADPEPYLSRVVYERMLAGRWPVLSAAELRAANSSGGVNLAVLHFGLVDHDLAAERSRAVLRSASQAFYFFNTGYRYNLLLNEVYGRQAADYMLGGGFRLLREFEGDELVNRPFLFGLRKEWIAQGAINQMGFLFDPSPPIFGFTPGEQRVLLRAMLTESDPQIAANLGVSLDSVKKTWRRVFDRAAAVVPHLFAAAGEPGARPANVRGSEKRRHLLDYLRIHLEELRPHRK
ncbi:MAG TPA: hypothetical protein VFO94_21000 [Gammaproteobacteria bacterium]|nr:hypothetical protein [Gammaproteobacteria bacterium]